MSISVSTSDSKLGSGVDANSHVPMRDANSSVRTVTTVAQVNNAFPESSTRIVHDVSGNSFLHTSITSVDGPRQVALTLVAKPVRRKVSHQVQGLVICTLGVARH